MQPAAVSHPLRTTLGNAARWLLLALPWCVTPVAAQNGVQDQVSPFAGAWFNGSATSLTWQQQVRAGVSGTLEGFVLEVQAPATPANLFAAVRVGPGWNTSTQVWTGAYAVQTTSAWERAWFDTSSAGIVLNAGDTFVIELWGDNSGTGIHGSYVAPPGTPLYPEELFLNQPGCYSNCGWRLGFETYVLTGPPRPTLRFGTLVAGQQADLFIDNATPGGLVYLGYSTTGTGPTPTACGPADLSPPITVLAPATADAAGTASWSLSVPGFAAGITTYLQGGDAGQCVLTQMETTTIQ